MQDCAYLVNYDLHWNPTRMIQRAGRIDRIGTDFDTLYVRNFFPDRGLERLLGLVQALQDKIRQIDATVALDASVLGEAINPKVFNTIKRIAREDEAVMDEEEAEAELASDEGLVRQLAEFLKASGEEALKALPDGIHSGMHRPPYRGVFLYYQHRGTKPELTEHFWRYVDAATGRVEDNRLAIAEMIRCRPDEPRVVDPALKADIHRIMETIENQILAATHEQESIQAAPRELSGDQTAVLVALQQALNRPGAERQRVLALLTALSRPLLSAPVKELTKARLRYQKDADTPAFVGACEAVAARYAQQPAGEAPPAAEARRPRRREDIRLICFEFLS